MTEGFVRCVKCNGLLPDIASYCGYCGREIEEEKEEAKPDWEGEEEAEEEEKQQIVKVRCHNCKRAITITSSQRPITVTCANCGAKGRLE